jgi:hypothetical protein
LTRRITHKAPSFFKQISLADSRVIYGTGTTNHGFDAELYLGVLSTFVGSTKI